MTGGRRSPHGERGLKFFFANAIFNALSRSPHGERGLKYDTDFDQIGTAMSLSTRRAWIEIA